MDDLIAVDTEWLTQHLDDPTLVLVDVRPPQFFVQGHIPGSVNLPIFLFSSPDGRVPSPEFIGSRLGNAGIGNHHHVVAYDDGESPSAAVLFRLLKFYRHSQVSILDGGITQWLHEGRDAEYSASQRPATQYQPAKPDFDSVATLDDVVKAIGADSSVLVDTRAPAEYLGLQRTASRNGHIPGAVNIEWSNNLIQQKGMFYTLRPDEEIKQLYRQAGVTPDKEVIVHCQSGFRASETYMVLKNLGYPKVRTYLPGWQEWGNRDDTPVEDQQ